MADFQVPVVTVDAIEPIPGADNIELAVIGGYRSVTKKGAFVPGDLAVYIPEGALVPDALLAQIGLTGKLSGSGHNRVKAIKLRGCLSQGILLSVEDVATALEGNSEYEDPIFMEGFDFAAILGIIKYEVRVPQHLSGRAKPLGALHGTTRSYDVESAKKYKTPFIDGEEVFVTSKIHGTEVEVGYLPDEDLPYVTSKGLGKRGIVYELDEDSLYVRVVKQHRLIELLKSFCVANAGIKQIVLFGEIAGMGVQDLTYNTAPTFFGFDIWIRREGEEGHFFNPDLFFFYTEAMGVDTVPLLYHGPYHEGLLAELSEDKKEQVSGKELHMEEGVVCCPAVERKDKHGTRMKLKWVTEQYLLRKGEVTEFQ